MLFNLPFLENDNPVIVAHVIVREEIGGYSCAQRGKHGGKYRCSLYKQNPVFLPLECILCISATRHMGRYIRYCCIPKLFSRPIT